jgi:hypothetical protein
VIKKKFIFLVALFLVSCSTKNGAGCGVHTGAGFLGPIALVGFGYKCDPRQDINIYGDNTAICKGDNCIIEGHKNK